MAEQSPEHHVKRILLPSGKTIEVVYFSERTEERPPAEPVAAREVADDLAPAGGLHVCPRCDSHLVRPTEWSEDGARHWRVSLHCPNCDWETSGVFSQELVDWFDEQLDQGTDALVRDLRRLTRANMEGELERFVAALAADAILPMDF